MLVIAGGVSGVLLSRGGDVISDLESADTNATEINTQDECTSAARNLLQDNSVSADPSPQTAEKKASWTGSSGSETCKIHGLDAVGDTFGRFNCEQYRGPQGNRGKFVSDPGTNANQHETCEIT